MPHNPRKLAAGTHLGAYEIRRRVGRGATATVYLAVHQPSGRQVALKAIHNDRAAQEERAPARLQREVQLVQRIDHPGVCRIDGLFHEQGVMFVAMEYVEGRNLDVVLREEGRFEPPRAARIVAGVCDALEAAHRRGILHRDLKPSNVMLQADDTPRLLDFGYATAPDVGRVTITGAWVGTMHYVAPEILKGEPATAAGDVYSLGVILYQLVTGALPFAGLSYGEIASAKLFRDPPAPSTLCDAVSAELDSCILRAMQREPALRFASVRDLQSGLVQVQLEEADTQPGLPEPVAKEITDPNVTSLGGPAPDTRVAAVGDATAPAQPAPTTRQAAETISSTPATTAPAAASRASAAASATPNGPDESNAAGESDLAEQSPAAPADLEARQREMGEALQEARRQRGIIAGDALTLDGLERTAGVHSATGQLAESCELLRLAVAEVQAVVVDIPFVERKLERFRERWRRAHGIRQPPQLAKLLIEVMKCVRAADAPAANTALNRAFDML